MLPKKITLKHMNKITAAITAIGSYVPEYVLSNQVLETLVDTNDEWITSRTGIKERRLLKEDGEGTSYLAIKAAQNLIEKSKIDPKITNRIWRNMIWSFIDYEKRNFRKK